MYQIWTGIEECVSVAHVSVDNDKELAVMDVQYQIGNRDFSAFRRVADAAKCR